MCGFVALLHPQGCITESTLQQMRDQLIHRGPDSAGLWQKDFPLLGSVNLGFRRLSILDTSDASNQPLVRQKGDLAMVFNGEIYNYIELRAELQSKGYHFKTGGDTEVLLTAYEHWGDDVIHKLNGMFAFVIWDGKKKSALAARDRFGEKPLYICKTQSGGFIFSSEIKAISACPLVKMSLDVDVLKKVIGGRLIYGLEETVFEGVRQCLPAHAMRVTLDGQLVRRWRYWSPNYDNAMNDSPTDELTERFFEHFERAVEIRTRSDVPVTMSLSGGLDSSSIASVLRDLGSRKKIPTTKAISAKFPEDPTVSEGNQIDTVLAALSMEGYAVHPTADELRRDLRRMHWHQETVVGGMSMYLEWRVMQKASELGYKVILDGQGADELLAGYQIYFQAYQIEQLNKYGLDHMNTCVAKRDILLAREARRYQHPTRRFPARDSVPVTDIPQTEAGLRHRYIEYDGDGMVSKLDSLLQQELAFNLLYSSLPSNVYSGDRNSMANSVEARYPFLDYELVDFCTQLPTRCLIDDGWQKRILRESMQRSLPPSIVWRVDKVGFAAPQDKWSSAPVIKKWIEERLFSGILTKLNFINDDVIEETWQQHCAGQGDFSSYLWTWASAGEIIDMYDSGYWN